MDGGKKLKATGKWKEVVFTGTDINLFDDSAMEGLISMQELTDYEISGLDGDKLKKKKKNEKKVQKSEKKDASANPEQRKAKQKKRVSFETGDKVNEKQAVKRKSEESSEEPKKKKRKKKKPKKKEKVTVADKVVKDIKETKKEVKVRVVTENDLPGWKGMFVPNPILRALKELGFAEPTPIQALTIPPAIRDRKDIVGAAETGSGKTLAFGIPLLNHIMASKALRNPQIEELLGEEDEELSDLEMEDVTDETAELGSLGSTDTSDNEEFPPKLDSDEAVDDESEEEAVEVHEGDEDDDTPDSGDEDVDESDNEEQVVESVLPQRPLYALILTPTRELAIQVENHIKKVAAYTDVKVTTLVGGISLDKQRRLLKRCPEIVVATPGRLWDLMQEGQPHLAQIPQIPFLVIDECDRMVEKGHFAELSSILELMNTDENCKARRQTFVFSATLTFVHDAPKRFKKKKKLKQLTSDSKLDNLISHIGIKAKPKVVDLTRKRGTAETLTETKIHCSVADKDLYLYYFLKQFPGRTLVFTNSKDCLRRLISILNLLQCHPLPLHADMHQKQRLKNLERFTASPDGLLVATDVAARGLDIPDVQHVIHFQVPQTTENYIHRSGRTARATKEGVSFTIIGPDDIKNYRKILRSLKRTEDIPQLPVELKYLPEIKDRLSLAKSIDKEEHKKAKANHHNNWFVKTARDMDIELDEDLLKDTGDSNEKAVLNSKVQQLKAQLKSLLRMPIGSRNVSYKYPTMTGELITPYMQKTDALDQVKNSKPLRLDAPKTNPRMKKTKSKRQRKKKTSN